MEMEDELNQIDWDNMFVDIPFLEDGFQIFEDVSPSLEVVEDEVATTTKIASGPTVESWIEELLMKDDDDEHNSSNQAAVEALGDDFLWSDLLVDSRQEDCLPSDDHRDSSDASPSPIEDKNSSTCSNSEGNAVQITTTSNNYDNSGEAIPNFESNGENDKSGDDALDLDDSDRDPLSKKRKRQLRNRDAALRSRERKKIYVKDLEMKSKYMEAECRRLGRLLQCCYAENQMLRISLGSAYGASLTKPESAVLLLESLLLVSLVWLMVNICLLPLHKLSPQNQGAVPLESVERKEQESAAAPKGKGTKVTELWVTLCFMRSKRCRASRTKMKFDFEHAVSCIN